MKNTLTQISELDLDLDNFYIISFRKGEIGLQGNFSTAVSKILLERGYNATVCPTNGNPIYTKENVTINLM